MITKKELQKLSIKELRKIGQGSAPEAGRDPYIGHSIRFFSIYFSELFLYLPITPLGVTVLSVLMFLLGVSLFVFNIYWLSMVAILIIYISIVLDGTNGELARLQKYRPEIGSVYIEPISHDIQYGLMFLPLAIAAYNINQSVWILLFAFIATISKILLRFFIMRFDSIILSERRHIDTEGEAIIPFNPNVNIFHKFYRFLNRNIFSSVGLIIPLFICAFFSRIDIFIIIFAVVYTSFALAHFTKQMIYIIKIDKPVN